MMNSETLDGPPLPIAVDRETDLVLACDLRAPRPVLWKCWTDPRLVARFFVPRPHRVLACEMDLRVGGRFDTTFDVDGLEVKNRGVFLEITEAERLVFTDAFLEGWKPAPAPFLTTVLLFEDAGPARTTITAIARHRSADARARHEAMGFHDGWGTVARQLEDVAREISGG